MHPIVYIVGFLVLVAGTVAAAVYNASRPVCRTWPPVDWWQWYGPYGM